MRTFGLTGLTGTVLFLNSLFLSPCNSLFAAESSKRSSSAMTPSAFVVISGRIVGSNLESIAGASISYRADGILRGAIADTNGYFNLSVAPQGQKQIELAIRSLGYLPTSVIVELPPASQNSLPILEIKLTGRETELEGMTVTTPRPAGRTVQHSGELRQRARQSLVPTNLSPTLNDPLIARPGSMHSGQIRVMGTNPVYHLNGQPIGQDPNHFEALTLLPSTVINSSELQSLGTSANHRQLAAIDLHSTPCFEQIHETEIQASSIEVTGTSRLASTRFAGLVSLRQAVINQVLGDFSANKAINSIPPTTFTDFYASGAFRVGPRLILSFDQFAGADDLEFNSSELYNDPSTSRVDMNQKSSDFISLLRLQRSSLRSKWSLGISRRSTNESYNAVPTSYPARLSLDLAGRSEAYGLTADGTTELSSSLGLTTSTEFEFNTNRSVDLSQRSWNFLPPFWNSDNPHAYQDWLNSEFDTLSIQQASQSAGASVGLSKQIARDWTLESGLRADYFSELRETAYLSSRFSLSHDFGHSTSVRLFYGASAESPVSGLLEPYQVLVRNWLRDLSAVRTTMTSASLRSGSVTISTFAKSQSSVPVLAPNSESTSSESFLTMRSTGGASFWGGSLSLHSSHFLIQSLICDLSYTYSQSWRSESGMTFAHELNSPHRFEGSMHFSPSPRASLGFSFMVRTGYPYSPTRVYRPNQTAALDPTLYQRSIIDENSLQFPNNGYLNLFGEYRVGQVILFGSVANVTNRANALVHYPRGFLYDTSLLPTIGFKFTL